MCVHTENYTEMLAKLRVFVFHLFQHYFTKTLKKYFSCQIESNYTEIFKNREATSTICFTVELYF